MQKPETSHGSEDQLATTGHTANGAARDRPTLDVEAKPDPPTVTPDGERLGGQIDGVRVRRAITQTDERGTICEIYSPAWGFTDEPVVYVYESTVRPGVVKGWVVHHEQDDRLFFSEGSAKVVLYDARTASPTHGQIDEVFFDAHNRGLLRIPAGVVHAVQNIGHIDARFVNMPTRPYIHDAPDKARIPLDTGAIPYRFSQTAP